LFVAVAEDIKFIHLHLRSASSALVNPLNRLNPEEDP